MKKANATLATCFGFFLLCALSMGNRMYLLISAIIALAWVFSLASVRMAEKSVKDISVRELAAIADINRGTFYIHYKDVYDLLSSLEDELADGLVVVCRRHNAKDSEGKTYPYLMELYQYIEQNADLCHVLLGKNGDIAFTDRICHILRDEFLYDFLAYYYPNDPAMLDYFCSFIVSGNMSLALTWIDGGMKQTAEEMAVLAGEIIMHGVKVLETKA